MIFTPNKERDFLNTDHREHETKIGIIGTHGVGKTTLALSLASQAKQDNPGRKVEVVAEVVRSCPIPVNEATTETSQRWIYCAQIKAEIEASIRSDFLICDRTALDNLAYAKRAGLDDLVESYFGDAVQWTRNTYTKIYWLRPSHALCGDGFRPSNIDFQTDIDRIICEWICEQKIKVFEGILGDFMV